MDFNNKLNERIDKEDSYNEFKVTDGLDVPKIMNNGLSTLKCLQPHISFESDEQEAMIKLKNELKMDTYASRNADELFDLLKLDDSAVEKCSDAEIKTPVILDKCEIFQVTDEEVVINDLISLCPQEYTVDKGIFDELKKHHNNVIKNWLEKENNYKKILDRLKEENNTKINDLLNSNEKNLEKYRLRNIKELTVKQSENEEKMLKIKREHDEKLNFKQLEKENILKELDIIFNELCEVHVSKYRFACDQHNTCMNQLIETNKKKIDDLNHGNDSIEVTTSKYVERLEKCQDTLSFLYLNQKKLKTDIEKYEVEVEDLNTILQESKIKLLETKEDGDNKYDELKAFYEPQLKRLEVKAKHLKNVEKHLKSELQLRINEKSQLEENLQELYK